MRTSRDFHTIDGFTRLELAALLATVAVLLGLIVAAGIASKSGKNKMMCASKLKQINFAYHAFSDEEQFPFAKSNSIAFGERQRAWIHYQALAKELSTPRTLACDFDVRNNQRKVADNFEIGKTAGPRSLSTLGNGAVSYFVGIDVSRERPEAILAGDRNLSSSSTNAAFSSKEGAVVLPGNAQWTMRPGDYLHGDQGIVLLGDGSVNQASSSTLQNLIKLNQEKYGTNANRLVFPQ